MIVDTLPGWIARPVPAYRAAKEYRCPACENTIRPQEGHVVVWREDDPQGRRHWHRHCWRVALRRGRIA